MPGDRAENPPTPSRDTDDGGGDKNTLFHPQDTRQDARGTAML